MPRRAARTREFGFTMVELMFALVVISIFMTAIAMALTTAMSSNRSDTNRMVTSNLASTLIENVRATDFETLKGQIGTKTIDPTATKVNGVQYTAKQTIQWVPGSGTITNCGIGTNAANIAYLRVDIAVSWPEMGAVRPVTNSTVVSPPVGQYNTNTGAIATQVTDSDGNPQQGITATLAGPSGPQTQLTTDQGCAFFPFLQAGSYTVSINKPGYVDLSGTTTPQSVATPVSAGPVTSIPAFVYDQASTINATIVSGTDPSKVAAAPSTTIPLYVANSYIQPSGWRQVTGTGTALSRTLANMYPFKDGYSVWPGTCVDSDPDLYRSDSTGPSLRQPIVAVTPGGTSAVTLPLATLIIKVTKSGVSQANRQVQLINTDTTCSSRTISYASTTKTDSSGLVVVSAPYGKWQVRASSTTGTFPTSGGTTVTISPSNSNPAQTAIVTVTSS